MILQELVRYYDRKSRDPDPAQRLPSLGLEDKDIPFIIELAADGGVVQLRDTRSLEVKKLRAQSFLVPQGVKKTSGVAANLLWDSAAYVIGLEKARKGKAEVTPHAAFRARIDALPQAAQTDAGLQAVLAALDRADWSVLRAHPAWAEIQETNPVMSFQLTGDVDLVCQRPAVAAAALPVADADARSGLCLVEGVTAPIQRLHSAIKGVWGAQSSGANIVSFNARSFESYGKTDRQGENAPVGERAAFAYTTALNHLLAKDSRNRVQVGDASTVFWADAPSQFDSEFTLADFFGETKDDPDRGVRAVQALHQALASGQLPVGERDAQFFVLGLAPNAARISVRFWMRAPLAELAPRICAWFEDLAIDHAPGESEFPMLVPLLAASCAPSKDRKNGDLQRNPSLVGSVIRGVLSGAPLPASWLNGLVERCRAEQARKREDGKPAANVSYYRAASVKAILNRSIRFQGSKEREFTVALDPDNTNVAYRLGRLFATYERVQSDAAGRELNKTIRDAYFGAAMGTPASVFPRLEVLNGHHLRSLRRDKSGLAVKRDKLLAEITWGLDARIAYPRTMPLHEQGRFALGYYHQRQAFFMRKEQATADNAPPDQEN